MKRLVSFVLLACGAVVAQGVGGGGNAGSPSGSGRISSSSPAAASSTAPAPKAEMSGTVVDAATGQPLKKTWITARVSDRGSRNPATAMSDSQGHFTFPSLDAGRYTLIATRNGYVSQTYGQKTPGEGGTPITLSAGQKLDNLSFRLTPGAVITGRVVDEDGEPLQRAQVQAFQFRYMRGTRQLMPVGNSMTDDRGEYRIFAISPGQVYVRAAFRGMMQFVPDAGVAVAGGDESQGRSTYAPVFYPNVREASQATPLSLRGGDEMRADFALQPERAYTITGRVLGAGPSGGRGSAFLMLVPRDQGDFVFNFGPGSNASADADGAFTFKNVLPGSYYIVAQQNGGDGNRASGRVPVDVANSDVQNIAVGMAPPVEVTGHVTFDGTTTAKLSAVRVTLAPEGSPMFGMFGGSRTPTTDDGSFTLQAAADEKYKLNIFGAPADMYVKSAIAGRDDVLQKGFSVSSGKTLDVVLAQGGKLAGTVKSSDGNAEPGVTVVVIPEQTLPGISNPFKTASTDQNGSFQLQGLRPGQYQVYAFEQVESGAYEDPDWLRRFADKARTVTIAEGAQQSLDLKPIVSTTDQ